MIVSQRRKKDQPIQASPLVLKRDYWLGANVFISPSVEFIGEGAVVGAGAVVTKNIPDWAIAVGVPTRIIKFRGEGKAD